MAPYEILGLPSTAKREDIKKAYRRLSLRYHPDRPDGDAEKYLVIRDAYECLIKPNTARIHDQYQHRTTPDFNVVSNTLRDNGDVTIHCEFNNILWIDSPELDMYYWTVLGYHGGNLLISKRNLIRCNYTFRLHSHAIGKTIETTCIFTDPRGKWEKFIDKFKYIW